MTEIRDADGTLIARLSDGGEWEWVREDLAPAELVALAAAPELLLVSGGVMGDVCYTTVDDVRPGSVGWAAAARSRLPWVLPPSWPLPTFQDDGASG